MKQSLAVYFILSALFLQSCSMEFLDEDSPADSASSYTRYDSEGDILYCYDSEDNLKWIEYYDYNSQGQCIFIKHTLPSGTVLWSYVYEWTGSDLVTEAYYDSGNKLSWFSGYSYSGGSPVMRSKYNGSSALQSFQTWTYNGTDKVLTTGSYSSSSALQWAYKHEYDGSGNTALTSIYGSDSLRDAYIDYDYDGSSRMIRATAYGSATASGNYEAPCEIPGFPTYGGVNTSSRNDTGISVPGKPTAPSTPVLSLTDSPVSYAWMSLWFFDSYGYTSATLNSSYLPITLVRSAPDYLKGHPLEADLSYDSSQRLTRKTTMWNGETVLDLVFGYDGDGYLNSLDTRGRSLYIPLRYTIGYTPINDYKVPEELKIYNESTLLQKFVYAYSAPPGSAKEYAKGISTITHYDGDNVLVGTYTFSYSDPILTINVTDSSTVYTGRFELTYDGDKNASFNSYDKDGNTVWNYQFRYEGDSRVSEAVHDENNLPDAGDFFSVESLFVDLGRFFP